jgi:glycosyltransferase involved in cell wall biosynthesis
MNKAKVSIILPMLNEAETIGKVIDEIPQRALEQAGYTVKVLNSNEISKQATKILRHWWCWLYRQPPYRPLD